MKRAISDAIWEWLPGVVAGWLPFMMFLIGAPFSDQSTPEKVTKAAEHLHEGIIVHVLILGITNSTVSIVLAFWRLFSMDIPQRLRGARGPVAVVMLSLATLLYLSCLYAWQEWGTTAHVMLPMALAGLISSLVTSLYLEFSVASLREQALQAASR